MPPPRRSQPNRIPQLREARGWSQQQLATMVGVQPSTVSRWESRLSDVRDHRKAQLASIFGVKKTEVMGWETDDDTKHDLAGSAL